MPIEDTWSGRSGMNIPFLSGRYRSWQVTPGFSKLPKPQRPVNPYTDWQTTTSTKPVDAFYVPKGQPAVIVYDGRITKTPDQITQMFASFASDHVSAFSEVAMTSQLKALSSLAQTKANIPVTLAEMPKTIDMLANTAKRIASGLTSLRRGDVKAVANALGFSWKKLPRRYEPLRRRISRPPQGGYLGYNDKVLTDLWLELRFGWLPLLKDVQGAAELLAARHYGMIIESEAYGSDSNSLSKVRQTAYTPWGKPSGDGGLTTETLTGRIQVKTKIRFRVLDKKAVMKQQMGLTNPYLFAWEMTPLSFVFDYFLNVGQYLEAMSALDGVEIISTCQTTLVVWSYTNVSQPTGYTDKDGTYYSNGLYEYGMTNRHFSRSSVDLTPPSLRPVYTKPLSLIKTMNMLSLMRSSYR